MKSPGLVFEEPRKASLFLCCTHEEGKLTLPSGNEFMTTTNNTEPFIRSCVDKYLDLARSCGFYTDLRHVAPPYC